MPLFLKMMKSARPVILVVGLWGVCCLEGLNAVETKTALEVTDATLTKKDRILILAPHPDDEIIGCAGIIQKARAMGLPIKVVFLTNGDSNEWSFLVYHKRPVLVPKAVQRMGEIRQQEAVAAAKVVGIPETDLIFMGYPDFGMLNIWNNRWKDRPAYKSVLTKVTAVPYKNAFRPGAPYKGEEVIKDIKAILRDFKPTRIFLSHPADHNGDHRAFYLFTRIALWDLESEMHPKLYPYIVHWKGWPTKTRGSQSREALFPPLPLQEEIAWQSNMLSPGQVAVKEQALKAHKSQYISSRRYLESFIRSNELFGDFPMIRLVPDQNAVTLSKYSTEPPPQLTDEEKAFFVGFEERSVRLQNGRLILTVKFSRPLAKQVGVSVYLFGYRPDRPFEDMPKIQIRFGTIFHRVLDQNIKLPADLVQITRGTKDIALEIPLDVLGNPAEILTSAQTYLGKLPIDMVSWRTIEIAK